MPALSQNFTFIFNSTSTVSLNYPNTGTTALIYSSEPLRGDGYFSGSDGNHTVQVSINNFIGRIDVQGTLSSSPSEADWFTIFPGTGILTVDTTGAVVEVTSQEAYASYTTSTTNIKTYNFLGNFVWLRSKVSNWTQGSVNSIKFNH